MDTTSDVRVLSTSTLMNEPVRNTAGEDIGKVEEYMLDLDKGCVAYAVLSFGGFMGIGEKLFAIPWNSMQLDQRNHCWVLDVSEERLRNAPGFDKDHWPQLDAGYRTTLDDFWTVNAGQREYSTTGTTSGTGYGRGGTGNTGYRY